MAHGDLLPAILTAGLLVVLGGLTGNALAQDGLQGETAEPSRPVLHLRGDHPGGGTYRNFTTEAPAGTDPFSVNPCAVAAQGSAEWCWQMHRSPRPWTLEAGADVEAILHLGALERVPLGLPDTQEPSRSGQLRIDVILTRGTSDEVANGTSWIEGPLIAGEDHATVQIPLHVPQDAHWNTEPGDSPAVELQVVLSGLVRRDEPPVVLTGSDQRDSRLVLPGFPLDAFREWEQEEHEEDSCREKILSQESCATDPGPETVTGPQAASTETAPAIGPGVLVVAALLGLGARARSVPRR